MRVVIPASTVALLEKTLDALEVKAERGGVPPQAAQSAAKRGLELRRKFGRGGTMVGVARARDISNGTNLSESTVRRMKAYFDRHEVDKQGKDWDNAERPSNGKIAWLLWGGDAGRAWATSLVKKWNREDGKKSLPRWLPNGAEITSLKQLAAVLSVDEKTAAYVVLDAHEPPEVLYKAAQRHVRDVGFWGAPYGTPLPLPPGVGRVSVPKAPKPSTSLTESREGKNRARAKELTKVAERFEADGQPERGAVYRLRSRQNWSGVRSYKRTERDAISLPVDGEVKTVAEYQPSRLASAIMRKGGIDPVKVYELDPSEAPVFHRAITRSKEGNPYSAAVYVYDVDEYRDMRLFVTPDGNSGFALKGDELVSVFKGDSNYRRVAHPLVHLSIEEGANRGDAFDTVLPHIYGDHGLTTVARVKWNDEYSPDGWEKDRFAAFNNGEPDVVFMAYMPDSIDPYQPKQGQVFDDYDRAYSFVKDEVLESKDVFGAMRGQTTEPSGGVTAPFQILKPVPRQHRDQLGRIIGRRERRIRKRVRRKVKPA